MIDRVGLRALLALGQASSLAVTLVRNVLINLHHLEDLEAGAAWSGTETDNAIMDAILPQLLSFPQHPPPITPLSDTEYDKQIKNVLLLLSKTPANQLTAGVSGGGDLMDILDPSINTLPFLYVLLAHINGTQSGKQAVGSQAKAFAPGGALWKKMEYFIENFNPIQIRYAGKLFTTLIKAVAKAARGASKPLLGIPPIQSAILRLDPTGSTLTSSHHVFAYLCMDARAWHAALPVLDKDIFHYPPNSAKAAFNPSGRLLCTEHENSSTFITIPSGLTEKLEYQQCMEYFLYGAMLYMMSKNWERAQLFLEHVLVWPVVNTASMIQVTAYKKWVIVNLLMTGRPQPMPKTVNGQAAKLYRNLAKAYDHIAEVFKDGISKELAANTLRAEVDAAQAIFQEDGNLGLVKQVVDAFRRFSISKLGQVYDALRIADVAQRTSDNPDDYDGTAWHVASMISEGQLNATLTQADVGRSVLRFAMGPPARTEEQMNEDLQKQLIRTTTLTNHVKEVDRKLGLNKEYIDWAKKAEKNKDLGPNGEIDPVPFQGPDVYGVEDEDMMEDL